MAAEGDLDFRGTLGVAKDAPVGFREIRLSFDLRTAAPPEQVAKLLELTERYCVVYQTLASPRPDDHAAHHGDVPEGRGAWSMPFRSVDQDLVDLVPPDVARPRGLEIDDDVDDGRHAAASANSCRKVRCLLPAIPKPTMKALTRASPTSITKIATGHGRSAGRTAWSPCRTSR